MNKSMEDLISRQMVIDKLETVGYDFSESGLSETELEEVCEVVGDIRQDMIDRIKQLPSAQPERKKGRWIPVTNGRGGHECSRCHNYAPSYQSGGEYLSDFCPNCGAKMEVGA